MVNGKQPSVCARSSWVIWALIFLVALALRAYRVTGWILNYDEGHWLLYVLRPELLLTTFGSSYARPDRLFVWLAAVSVRLLGPNELALRVWPVMFGALTVFPLGRFVSLWTRNDSAGKWAAALFAVSPLPVYLNAQALPDTLAIFFVWCGVVSFARLVETPQRMLHLCTFCFWMALALLAKATTVYLWVFLALVGPIFLPERRARIGWCLSLFVSLVPFAIAIGFIKWRGSPLTFLEQSTVRSTFGVSAGRVVEQSRLFARFFMVDLLPMAAGVWIAWKRNRKWLVWLALLTLVVVTPTFRVNPRELLYVLPAVGLFSGLAVEMFMERHVRAAVFGFLLCVSLLLDCFGVRAGSLGPSVSDQTTAVLDRPTGWPSREATQWLQSHVKSDESILVTGLGFTDPVVIQLREKGVTMYPAASNWERLRDPANKIKYAVFVDDPRVYAPEFVRYADAHFITPADARFPGYTIYECRKDDRFVAYPDALNNADAYIQQGTGFLQAKQCDKAIEAFQTAVQIDPGAVGVKRDLMLACLACDRKEDAVRVGAELLQAEPADPVVNANMVILDMQLGLVEDGLAQCRKNIRLNIAPAISWGVLGQLLEMQGDLGGARDAYEKSLALDPGNEITARLLANVKAKTQQKSSTP